MNLYHAAEAIFKEAVQSVHPEKLIRAAVSVVDGYLHIGAKKFPLSSLNRIYVVGAGKASAGMAKPLEEILGDLISEGLIAVKYGHELPLNKIKQVPAAHPVPDEKGAAAAAEIHRLLNRIGEQDLVICLWSGGASALLADYPAGIDLADLQAVSDHLLRSGAAIGEINTVRKHLSTLKGGQFARCAWPAQVVSLIISDVVGDDPATIASGPSVPDTGTFQDALQIVRRYFPAASDGNFFSRRILDHLEKGSRGLLAETPKPGDPVFEKVSHFIIGSNEIALAAAAAKAEQLGFFTRLLGTRAEGPAEEIASFLATHALSHRAPWPACLLLGGESTVEVRAEGKGGRNQHLALAAALALEARGNAGAVALSAGTDGTDGPTDMAGAVAGSATLEKARGMGLDPQDFLARCDSYRFFEQVGGHVYTGPTQTNVMDLMLVMLPGKQKE